MAWDNSFLCVLGLSQLSQSLLGRNLRWCPGWRKLLMNLNLLFYSFSPRLLVFFHHRHGEEATSVFLLPSFKDTVEPIAPQPVLLLIKQASSSSLCHRAVTARPTAQVKLNAQHLPSDQQGSHSPSAQFLSHRLYSQNSCAWFLCEKTQFPPKSPLYSQGSPSDLSTGLLAVMGSSVLADARVLQSSSTSIYLDPESSTFQQSSSASLQQGDIDFSPP